MKCICYRFPEKDWTLRNLKSSKMEKFQKSEFTWGIKLKFPQTPVSSLYHASENKNEKKRSF